MAEKKDETLMYFDVEFVRSAIVLGVGATLVMDLWAIIQKRLFNVPSLDYALVGRWIGHMAKGRFFHHPIGKASAISGEAALGWFMHYAIGVVFAGVFLTLASAGWIEVPQPVLAIGFGLVTVLFPFLIMQPAFGAGIAASNMPTPNIARVRSLIAHGSFGGGLYLCGWLVGLN